MIKAGDLLVTGRMQAMVEVECIDVSDNSVKLDIDGMWFRAQDIKELRKFLKKLQKQLEDMELRAHQ